MKHIKTIKYRPVWRWPWQRKKYRWSCTKIRELCDFVVKHILENCPCHVQMTPDLAAALDTLNPSPFIRNPVSPEAPMSYRLVATNTPVALDMDCIAQDREMHAIIRPVMKDEMIVLRCGDMSDFIGNVPDSEVWESNPR